MKFFGEYLVEKGLIEKSQLVDALIEQIEQQPSIVRCVRDGNLLSTDEILETLKFQIEHQLSFLEAAKKLSFWTEEKTAALVTGLSVNRLPLGEILVSKKILDVVTLTRALDDFFAVVGANTTSKVS